MRIPSGPPRFTCNQRAHRRRRAACRPDSGHCRRWRRNFTSTMTSTEPCLASRSISPKGVRRLRSVMRQPLHRRIQLTQRSAQRPEADGERKKPSRSVRYGPGGLLLVDLRRKKTTPPSLIRNLALAAYRHFFAYLGRLADTIPEIVQLGATNTSETLDLYLLDPG